jgi:hypothetical protein
MRDFASPMHLSHALCQVRQHDAFADFMGESGLLESGGLQVPMTETRLIAGISADASDAGAGNADGEFLHARLQR